MAVKFVCPNCSGEVLECCTKDAFVSSQVTLIDEDGDFEYGKPCIHESSVDRFQCAKCGFILEDPDYDAHITEPEDVVKWCKDNCKQEE